MTIAQEFAKLAAQIGQIADLLKPNDSDPLAQARKLAAFHLHMAAKIVREIAEHKAGKEGTAK